MRRSDQAPVRRCARGWLPRLGLALASSMLAGSMLAPLPAQGEQKDQNILQTRARVADMAESAIEMLESQMQLTGVAGWAVFTGDRLPPDLDAGAGMAEAVDGESYFLRTPHAACLTRGYRHVLVFRDEDLFRDFRQGEIPGDALERHRSESPEAKLMAVRFRPAEPPRLEPLDLSGCRFALHRDLQRALVAKPSETEGLLEDDEVDVHDN